MTKIYIIGHRNINTLEVGLAIQSKDDSITVAPRFTTNIDEVTEYKYFLDKETVNISYKNNAIITITTDDNESNGIIYDDYYNNDIFWRHRNSRSDNSRTYCAAAVNFDGCHKQ